jgi:hypothetical protein
MPKNSYAPYKNPDILAVVSQWFEETYGTTAHKENGFLTVHDLYQSYSEYTLDPKYLHYRLNVNEFAKCIVACKILDIGGRFRYAPSYVPTVSAITRATA